MRCKFPKPPSFQKHLQSMKKRVYSTVYFIHRLHFWANKNRNRSTKHKSCLRLYNNMNFMADGDIGVGSCPLFYVRQKWKNINETLWGYLQRSYLWIFETDWRRFFAALLYRGEDKLTEECQFVFQFLQKRSLLCTVIHSQMSHWKIQPFQGTRI